MRRFDIYDDTPNGSGGFSLHHCDDGDYVAFADVEPIIAENAQLRAASEVDENMRERARSILTQTLAALARTGNAPVLVKSATQALNDLSRMSCTYAMCKVQRELDAERATNERLTTETDQLRAERDELIEQKGDAFNREAELHEKVYELQARVSAAEAERDTWKRRWEGVCGQSKNESMKARIRELEEDVGALEEKEKRLFYALSCKGVSVEWLESAAGMIWMVTVEGEE